MVKGELRIGMVVWLGDMRGTVTGFSGQHGVRVERLKHWTTQDFLTGRLSSGSSIVSQVWPIRRVSSTAPVAVEAGGAR